jgi:hypothetical protein
MAAALNLPDTTTGTAPKDRQSADPENSGDIHTATSPSISTLPYGCAKISGNKDGSMPSDGMGGTR